MKKTSIELSEKVTFLKTILILNDFDDLLLIAVVFSNYCMSIAVVFFIIAHPGYQSRIKLRWYFLAVVFFNSVVSVLTIIHGPRR